MSRFSKSEAEERGWVLVHESDEDTVTTSETQGETRRVAPSVRFEKTVNGQNVSIEGETLGLALERIAAYEAHLDSAPEPVADVLPLSGLPKDADGDVVRTVRTEEGDITEAEFSGRARRNDVIVTDEGQQLFSGVTIERVESDDDDDEEEREEPASLEDIDRALAARDEAKFAAEVERTEEPAVRTKQIEVDTSHAVDAPGIGAGGTLVIPSKRANTPEKLREHIDAEAQKGEVERVAVEQDSRNETEKLVDNPEAFAHGGILAESPTTDAIAEQQQAAADAVKDKRDDQGEKAQEGGSAASQHAAGIEAEQSVASDQVDEADADRATGEGLPETTEPAASEEPAAVEAPTEEQHDQFTEKDDTAATDAAIAHAKETGVDLSEVKGTGEHGRITAPDVDAAADARKGR